MSAPNAVTGTSQGKNSSLAQQNAVNNAAWSPYYEEGAASGQSNLLSGNNAGHLPHLSTPTTATHNHNHNANANANADHHSHGVSSNHHGRNDTDEGGCGDVLSAFMECCAECDCDCD
jgi:hypothetical protein